MHEGFGGMGLSNVYGSANDEESKAVLRRAIELGCVSSVLRACLCEH
jgi:aryl-alcohol dehydrogenase-like predicted oxidoreductase